MIASLAETMAKSFPDEHPWATIGLFDFLLEYRMTTPRPLVLTAALLPDHRVMTKVNTRDVNKALDKILFLDDSDELYEEALSHALSYVKLLDDGQIEIKVRYIANEAGGHPDASIRTKLSIGTNSPLHGTLQSIAGPLEPNKQIWLDLPKNTG